MSLAREKEKVEAKRRKLEIFFSFLAGVLIGAVVFVFSRNIYLSFSLVVGVPLVVLIYFYFANVLKKSSRIKKIESVFPDFLQLVSSNLRAGMTIDKAMLSSSRKEFSPLDEEILITGKQMATGKSTEQALLDFSKRLNSEKIDKIVRLIISGIRAGGNLANLLEQTSVSLREREFVEKKASSNVSMYVIFIFVAVAVGAPLLFALSGILVDVMTDLLSGMPSVDADVGSLPMSFSGFSISLTFLTWFSVVFILCTDILASLFIGLVSKGEEKEGLKFIIPLILISLGIYFAVRFLLADVIKGLSGL